MKIHDIKVNQLIDIEVDYNTFTEKLPSRIEEIDKKYLYVSMPLRQGVFVPLRLGQQIRIILEYKHSMFSGAAVIMGRKHDPIPMLIVSKPDDFININQKREFVRLSIILPVRFRILSAEADNKQQTQGFEGMTVDISAGGIYFTTKAPISAEQTIELEIVLSTQEVIKCKAEVIRTIKESHRLSSQGVAARYTDISEGQRDKIFNFIFAKQRDWIKKGLL